MKNERLRAIVEEQQRGHEGEPLFAVGCQLLEIAEREPASAELLERDLTIDGMKLEDAAKKLQEYADKNHGKQKCFCITPSVAEGILRKFYGLGKAAKVPEETEEAGIDLADYL